MHPRTRAKSSLPVVDASLSPAVPVRHGAADGGGDPARDNDFRTSYATYLKNVDRVGPVGGGHAPKVLLNRLVEFDDAQAKFNFAGV